MGYEKGLVVFIDVLGTCNNKNFDSKLLIHNLWHKNAKDVEERGKNFQHMRTLKRKVFSFSDCAYYSYVFNERATEERRNSITPFYEVLSSLIVVIQQMMNKGIFIRGGAVLGDVYVDDNGLFGPAVEKAYEIESKIARYPRIVLDDNLGAALLEYEKNFSFESHPIVYKDENCYFLNLFYGFIVNNNCGLIWDNFFENLQDLIKKNIDSLDENMDIDKKNKIHEKMRWLSNEAIEENKKLLWSDFWEL